MGTASSPRVVLTSAEREVVLHAMGMYVTSLERAERGAKDRVIADAYRTTASMVRTLASRIQSGELEI